MEQAQNTDSSTLRKVFYKAFSRPWPPAVRFALFSPARRPSAVTQPVYFATMALLDRRACRMVAESGGLARASPSRRPWLETALFTAPAGNSPLS